MVLATGCKEYELKQTAPTPRPGIELALDVSQAGPAQVVHIVTRDIPAGGEIPWHTHPGVEIAYVESGRVELTMAGRDVLRLGPGGHFAVERGVVHSGRNAGKLDARLVITYIVDKDAPLRSPASPPEEERK